jgi:hypothetical protein
MSKFISGDDLRLVLLAVALCAGIVGLAATAGLAWAVFRIVGGI